jgi:hypothetical protein
MEWSCALYRAVQEHGMSQAEAGTLVETIMLDVYRPVAVAMFRLSRLRSAKRETRVKWLLNMLTRHFYTSPFQHRHLPSEAGVAMALRIATSDGNSRHRESDPRRQDSRECPRNAN